MDCMLHFAVGAVCRTAGTRYISPNLHHNAYTLLEKKLNACQQWWLRRLLRISHIQCVTNTEVLRRTNQSQLSTVLFDRCLRLFGHVAMSDARMDHSRALRAVELPSHWRRPPGRPRQSWTRTIEKDLSALSIGLHTAWRRAQNHEQWQWTMEEAVLHHGACPWWWWWWLRHKHLMQHL